MDVNDPGFHATEKYTRQYQPRKGYLDDLLNNPKP